jgi:hypothetical protein
VRFNITVSSELEMCEKVYILCETIILSILRDAAEQECPFAAFYPFPQNPKAMQTYLRGRTTPGDRGI